jgi:hypothetical protein
MVADSDITLWPEGFEGPALGREVHTEIRALQLAPLYTGELIELRAGTGFSLPLSPGQVDAQDGGGDPANDFPADSFFDVYVELDLPVDPNGDPVLCPVHFPGGTLYNDSADPLLVLAEDLDAFPPTVVYRHGNSNAIPIRFKTGSAYWAAGEIFGYLRLAGHGVDPEFTQQEIDEFEALEFEQMPQAVAMNKFTAVGFEDHVEIEWVTTSEIDNAGFNIYRGLSMYEPNEKINAVLIPARGTVFGETPYSFVDKDVVEGTTYYYWVEAIDVTGAGTNSKPVTTELGQRKKDGATPPSFFLAQNHPNPFNPMTEIKYELPMDCHVRLEVYNVLGQRVATLVNQRQTSGYKVVRWDAGNFASGIYLYRIEAGNFVQMRKMVLLR